MIQLESGNVLLKPTQRKQMMARLKRVIRLGERLGQFVMRITLHRVGRMVEMVAKVRDRFGEFTVRARASNWASALHSFVTDTFRQLHTQSVHRPAAA
jgi:hypothetical protein